MNSATKQTGRLVFAEPCSDSGLTAMRCQVNAIVIGMQPTESGCWCLHPINFWWGLGLDALLSILPAAFQTVSF